MIRSVTPSDVNEFIHCYVQVFKTLYGILPDEYVKTQIEKATKPDFHENLLKELENRNAILLTSTKGDTITGMAWGIIKEDGSSWLRFMGVTMSYRGYGLGRALLNRFIEESMVKGAKVISLNTDSRLVQAVRLYESTGFHVKGTVKNPFGLELILYSKDITI
jgi:ribosomal protein S18 acetylase RimI-like enzyme